MKYRQKGDLNKDRMFYVFIYVALISIVAVCITYNIFVTKQEQTLQPWDDDILDALEEKLIILALKTSPIAKDPKGEKFTVLRSETCFDVIPVSDKRKEIIKEYAKKQLKIEGYDIAGILNDLINKNNKPVPLYLRPEPPNIFIIDSENYYRDFFKKNPLAWEKFHRENPKIYGLTSVSRPAYDKKNGIVLIYIDIVTNGMSGFGIIYTYKYDGKALKELGQIGLWVS